MAQILAALRQVALAPDPLSVSSDAAAHRVVHYLGGIALAYAERTVQGLASDWRLFSAWCAGQGVTALGATPETVSDYVASLAKTHAPGTIRRHLASLSHLHRALGFPNPVDRSEVRLAWRVITRQKEMRPARRRTPLRQSEIETLLAPLGENLIDRRDRALLLVARDSLARRSELSRLTVADIAWQAPKNGAQILVRRAKNDPTGEGRLAWLAPATREALGDYLAAGRLKEGTIFRRVIAGRRLGPGLKPHPHLTDGAMIGTSPLLWLAEDGSAARTLSRYYRLGVPLIDAMPRQC